MRVMWFKKGGRSIGLLLFLSVALAISLCVAAQSNDEAVKLGQEIPLSGSLMIGGPEIAEVTQGNASSPYIYLSITGAAARAIFDSLNAKAVPDLCLEKGYLMKEEGEIACSGHKVTNQYACWVGIDVRRQRLHNGYLC